MESLLGILSTSFLGTPGWFWLAFIVIIIALLALDLGVLHRDQHEIEMRESLLLYAGYFSVGVAFGGWIWFQLGATKALEFYTGFLVEQSLSMDNVFVMAMILNFLAIPRRYQHRVLFWGIIGVVVLRAIMIGLGTALVQNFEWVLYIFGAFLFISGIRMLFTKEEEHPDLSQNKLLLFLRRHLRITDRLHEGHFLVRQPDKTGKVVLFAAAVAGASADRTG
jgi:tellurite resistance protein TerC